MMKIIMILKLMIAVGNNDDHRDNNDQTSSYIPNDDMIYI